jgi:hypothetical protein
MMRFSAARTFRWSITPTWTYGSRTSSLFCDPFLLHICCCC